MKDKWFYLAIAVAVLTAWMFRWQVTPIVNGKGEYERWIYWVKQDRLTGNSYLCMNIDCIRHYNTEPEEIKQ